MDWTAFNQSRTGKIIVVLAVIAAVLVGLALWARHQQRVAAEAPLPGAGQGDRCAVWFIGSSTMHRWTGITEDMTPWKAVARGIEGGTFADINAALARDPARIPPRAIVLYAGENDLANGASVDQVQSGLRGFIATKTKAFGQVPVLIVSLKPSPGRWSNRPAQVRYNAAARALAERDFSLGYVEIGPLLMNGDSPGDHYRSDGIHLTPEAYRLWAPVLDAALRQRLGTPDCVS